nr:hypothetical protein [Petropleomorpha daqingensis]
MSPRPGAAGRVVAGALLCAVPLLTGCTGRTVAGVASAAPGGAVPSSPEELERLIIRAVPSGLSRVPDDALSPPAGEKWVGDVAAYAPDPDHERGVLDGYGFRFGWERFWGAGDGSGPVTSVFVYQFAERAGASAYAEDLAGNDAESYRGMLSEDPDELPGGCQLVTVDEPEGLPGPAASAWCGHGVFSVAVTSVADSPSHARREVAEALRQQLALLPPG